MIWKEAVALLIGLIFLTLLSARTNALEINDDQILKLKAGEQAPYGGVFMPDSYYYFYEGSVSEIESCRNSLTKLDTMCFHEPQLDLFSKSAKPYLLGALTGAAVVLAVNAKNDSDKIIVLSGALALNLIFAF